MLTPHQISSRRPDHGRRSGGWKARKRPLHQSRAGVASFVVVIGLSIAASVLFAATAAPGPAVGFGVAALILFLLVGTGLVPQWLAARLQAGLPPPPPIPCNDRVAIVILGDGTSLNPATNVREPHWISYSRLTKAAALYRAATDAGTTCRIFIAGERTRYDRAQFAVTYPPVLESLGVPLSCVESEETGRNTYRHAELVMRRVREESLRHVFLVTSGLHLKRAALYFAQFGATPHLVAADYIPAVLSPVPLGYNFAVAEIAWHQVVGILRLHLYNALGWNRKPQ